MTTEQIIEGNKLIAESPFVSDIHRKWIEKSSATSIRGIDTFVSQAKYHSSWDWLMPVVEKIETLGFYTTIGSAFNQSGKQRIYTEIGTKEVWDFMKDVEPVVELNVTDKRSKIEASHEAVVEFIKWYNTSL